MLNVEVLKYLNSMNNSVLQHFILEATRVQLLEFVELFMLHKEGKLKCASVQIDLNYLRITQPGVECTMGAKPYLCMNLTSMRKLINAYIEYEMQLTQECLDEFLEYVL